MSGECAELIESMVDPTIEPSLEVTRLPRLRGMRDMQMLLRLRHWKVPDGGTRPGQHLGPHKCNRRTRSK